MFRYSWHCEKKINAGETFSANFDLGSMTKPMYPGKYKVETRCQCGELSFLVTYEFDATDEEVQAYNKRDIKKN